MNPSLSQIAFKVPPDSVRRQGQQLIGASLQFDKPFQSRQWGQVERLPGPGLFLRLHRADDNRPGDWQTQSSNGRGRLPQNYRP